MKHINFFLGIIILSLSLSIKAQNETIINSEIGILFGPVFMQTDYLTDSSSKAGVDFGVAYIANFSPSRYKSKVLSWIVDHVKARVELSFSRVKLEHDLNRIENLGLNSNQFEGMRGNVKLFNFGVFGEFNFLSLLKTKSKVHPYLLVGGSYTSANSSVIFDSNVGAPPIYTNSLFLGKNNVASLTSGLGLRFKLTDVDLIAEGRFQSFFSDRVEGIDTDVIGDENNDTQILFKIGAVFYLN
ncbi:MAG: hypothetical protein L3J23_03835 [Flavobacteriaceae bacterium]|nr:hypothetical protein [Flavobacteriaceae bacterium]